MFNLYQLEKAFFVATSIGREDWEVGTAGPNIEDVDGEALALDMGLASLTHAMITVEDMRKRMENLGAYLRRRELKRLKVDK